jgi:type 1 fimbriae regulatory protein FimB
MLLSDVDLTAGTLYVRHQKSGGKGSPTHPSVHPIYKADMAALRAWLKIRRGMEAKSEHLFISEQRDGFTRAAINLLVTKIAKAALLDHLAIHPHSFRHAAGYGLINKGVDVRIVQSFLGHKRLDTTARYTELPPGRLKNLF